VKLTDLKRRCIYLNESLRGYTEEGHARKKKKKNKQNMYDCPGVYFNGDPATTNKRKILGGYDDYKHFSGKKHQANYRQKEEIEENREDEDDYDSLEDENEDEDEYETGDISGDGEDEKQEVVQRKPPVKNKISKKTPPKQNTEQNQLPKNIVRKKKGTNK
jgi:hypothetical protein